MNAGLPLSAIWRIEPDALMAASGPLAPTAECTASRADPDLERKAVRTTLSTDGKTATAIGGVTPMGARPRNSCNRIRSRLAFLGGACLRRIHVWISSGRASETEAVVR